ncbi:dual specificity protein phosphatase 18 isoform X2 [Dasypus novemcinctus]|uniref:dual specificity protein phosphatase 18 isoform X2 n=1 Tax=Dasypus novemcinctus TaxID=9361 RepID=UPI0003292105|nr:dual specificity protein phosphatase 18 isoform X2 [Dasypus novemcinctus]
MIEPALGSGARIWSRETSDPAALMTAPPCAFPVECRHPSVHGLSQITSSLYISSGVAANNKLMLSRSHITTVINVSVEVVNTIYEDIRYVQVPVADAPSTRLCDFFDPIADHIHGVGLEQGRTLLHCAAGVSRSATLCLAYLMKYHAMSLLDAHMWTKSCRPIIRPNNGFWEQLIHYEFQLFGKNTVHMVNSPMGVIPDIYEKEVCSMIPL